MASQKFYLDTRRKKDNDAAILKLAISHKNDKSLISLDIRLTKEEWRDKEQKVDDSNPDKLVITTYLDRIKSDINSLFLTLTQSGELKKMSCKELKYKAEMIIHPEKCKPIDESLFITRFNRYIENKKPSTKEVYEHTLNRIKAFLQFKKRDINHLRFDDITVDWLNDLNAFMALTSPSQNARNIHFRNIRAVINNAIENEITTNYPFRKFKIKSVETAKRSLSVEELRQIVYFPCEPHQEKYVDMFKLSFYLMGVNIIDLCKLTEIRNGRLIFNRTKTDHLYSMKVEPEAAALIEKHKGTNHLLFILDHWKTDELFRRKMNKELQKLGPMKKKPGRGGKKEYSPLFPKLTTYWARHTWATIADDLDIPYKVIAAGLGHTFGNPTTNIYIRRNIKKVDLANRKILDWVLYGILDGKVEVEPGTPEFYGLEEKQATALGLSKSSCVNLNAFKINRKID